MLVKELINNPELQETFLEKAKELGYNGLYGIIVIGLLDGDVYKHYALIQNDDNTETDPEQFFSFLKQEKDYRLDHPTLTVGDLPLGFISETTQSFGEKGEKSYHFELF